MSKHMLEKSMHRTTRWIGTVLTGALVAALAATGPPASAGTTQPNVPWSAYLSGWTDQYIPTSDNDCVAGRDKCLKATLRELARVADDTATSCSHNAIFARAYLRMTQTYGWSRAIPGYYADVPFANHQDAVFAKYFTDSYYNYQSGNRAAVPEAWQIALDASRDERVTGTGSLLLGMNAHINRDLPFVLAAVGLVAPDGSSRKPDYDAVERWLYTATEPLIAEFAARFDPTVDDGDDPYGISNLALFQLVSQWRETAWRNAEALVSAPTADARAQVAASIEAAATQAAKGILATQSYVPGLSSPVARDRFCRAHYADAPPEAYDFGWAKPFGY
ncbi:hypothetical protein FB382_000816 [Nocardioides ginsengisegetis]|uniref:Uncharacterized protein n=1 Tax=Nocardioides ginsengisegetis TaxID=661491 RepID=A0A7W3IXL7_9ACTN|nr:DUF5995 family protein [Nocardioides ginsengisegetis]MBA8802525.1 hypothetical protein [Nocardioides ginsengisegetis]